MQSSCTYEKIISFTDYFLRAIIRSRKLEPFRGVYFGLLALDEGRIVLRRDWNIADWTGATTFLC